MSNVSSDSASTPCTMIGRTDHVPEPCKSRFARWPQLPGPFEDSWEVLIVICLQLMQDVPCLFSLRTDLTRGLDVVEVNRGLSRCRNVKHREARLLRVRRPTLPCNRISALRTKASRPGCGWRLEDDLNAAR